MATIPRVGLPGVVQATSGRFRPQGPVAPVDPTPLAELNEKAMIANDGAAFRYEDFTGRPSPGRPAGRSEVDRRQGNFSNLVFGSSVSFVDAFSIDSSGKRSSGSANPPAATLNQGIGTYEMNAKVITGDLDARGEKLSLSL